MADNDVQLDLKKRARRRLVGAIALALFAAIVLPMVMDREPKPASNELQIRIPGQEGNNFASRFIAGNAPPPVKPSLPASTGASQPTSAASQTPPRVIVPPSDTSRPAAVQSVPAVPASGASRPAQSKPATEAQRAREILEGKPAEAPDVSASPGKFYVQLGVFRDEANAHEVLSRAATAGVKAAAIKVDSKTRLRAGPFDRAGAEAVVARLKKAGMNGIVTSK